HERRRAELVAIALLVRDALAAEVVLRVRTVAFSETELRDADVVKILIGHHVAGVASRTLGGAVEEEGAALRGVLQRGLVTADVSEPRRVERKEARLVRRHREGNARVSNVRVAEGAREERRVLRDRRDAGRELDAYVLVRRTGHETAAHLWSVRDGEL